MKNLPEPAMSSVAAYFQALAEPTRLRILNALRDGERNVSDLAQMCACTSANASRHLSLLMQRGLVVREGRGTAVYYRIAEDSVYALCDLVCDNISRQLQQAQDQQRMFKRSVRADVHGSSSSSR